MRRQVRSQGICSFSSALKEVAHCSKHYLRGFFENRVSSEVHLTRARPFGILRTIHQSRIELSINKPKSILNFIPTPLMRYTKLYCSFFP